MPRMSITYLRLFVLLAALLFCIGPTVSAPSYGRDKDEEDDKYDNKGDNNDYKGVIRVKNGESIQAAIRRAKPYTRIEVEGEHWEQVTIKKDGISLVGKGAKLYPPSPDNIKKRNYCYGLVKVGTDEANLKNVSAGICIHGRKIQLAPKYEIDALHWKVESVGDPVKDVSVSGFEISDFDGENIVVYGGKDTKISNNKLYHGQRYGFLTVGSRGTEASNNIVVGAAPATLQNGPIAMCMDDLSSAVFSYNDISDYWIGLCTETSEGVNRNNKVHGCCLGNILDPNVYNAKSLYNDISARNPGCAPDSAAGISLLGSKNALVKGNKISIGSGLPQGGAGVFLGLEDVFNATNEGNVITKNVFGDNDADIFDDSRGKNFIFDNTCDLAFRGPLTSITPAPEYCQPRKGY